MISQTISRSVGRLRDAIAAGLVRLRVSPNALTVFGCLVTMAAGVLIVIGRLPAGGLVLIAAGACDVLDGAVARVAGRTTRFGAFLDSSLDRISDVAIFGSLALHFARLGNLTYALLSISALGAAEVISYTRARAECVIDSCKVGFWERGERMVLIIVALVAGRESLALWILATLPWLTVLHRIGHARRAMIDESAVGVEGAGRADTPVHPYGRVGIGARLSRLVFFCPPRGSIAYDLVAGAILAAVLFIPLRRTDPLHDVLAPYSLERNEPPRSQRTQSTERTRLQGSEPSVLERWVLNPEC